MVLIEFLFAAKDIEDQGLRPNENIVAITFSVAVVALVPGGTPTPDFT
jgi:hypothetical protein